MNSGRKSMENRLSVGASDGTNSTLATIVDILRQRAANETHRIAFTFLRDAELDEINLTYGELDRKSRAVAALLQSHQLEGERVLLLLPSGLDYVAAFFGCLYASAIAVPGFPVNL